MFYSFDGGQCWLIAWSFPAWAFAAIESRQCWDLSFINNLITGSKRRAIPVDPGGLLIFMAIANSPRFVSLIISTVMRFVVFALRITSQSIVEMCWSYGHLRYVNQSAWVWQQMAHCFRGQWPSNTCNSPNHTNYLSILHLISISFRNRSVSHR